jgi:hypothetical protein
MILQDVSREFRSTLEQEIGLDEYRDSYRTPMTPPPQQRLPPSAAKPPAEEAAAKPDPSIEEDRPCERLLCALFDVGEILTDLSLESFLLSHQGFLMLDD